MSALASTDSPLTSGSITGGIADAKVTPCQFAGFIPHPNTTEKIISLRDTLLSQKYRDCFALFPLYGILSTPDFTPALKKDLSHVTSICLDAEFYLDGILFLKGRISCAQSDIVSESSHAPRDKNDIRTTAGAASGIAQPGTPAGIAQPVTPVVLDFIIPCGIKKTDDSALSSVFEKSKNILCLISDATQVPAPDSSLGISAAHVPVPDTPLGAALQSTDGAPQITPLSQVITCKSAQITDVLVTAHEYSIGSGSFWIKSRS